MPKPSPSALSPVAAIARAEDPDRFLAALFAPPARREALFALIAYNHELARARVAAKTPLIALMRLQWWRDAVAEAAAGAPARRHEVATPLHAAIAAGLLDPADLAAMADAREAEAEEEGIPSPAAFDAYLRGTAGGFAVAAGRLLGVTAGAQLAALQRAGTLYGLGGVLRSVPALARQGRSLLPTESIPQERVLAEPGAAAPLLRDLAAAGLSAARPLAAALRGLPRTAIAAALPLVLARRDLRRLAAGEAAERRLSDRFALSLAGLRGRV
jgi:phytoene synthase